jgi:hypothetical protein
MAFDKSWKYFIWHKICLSAFFFCQYIRLLLLFTSNSDFLLQNVWNNYLRLSRYIYIREFWVKFMAPFGIQYFTCDSTNNTRWSLRTIHHTLSVSPLRDKTNLIVVFWATHLERARHSCKWRFTGTDKINGQEVRNCALMRNASIVNSVNSFKNNTA